MARFSRRQVLRASAALPLAAALRPRRAHATVSAADRRFVFLFATGGWDVTAFFAPEFDNANVTMENTAERATTGNIDWVDHPQRPTMRSFIEQYYERLLFLQGVQIPSVSHAVCNALTFTGTTRGERADWGTLLAASRSADFPIPHLVINGPSFQGEHGAHVARIGQSGQLHGLLQGTIADSADQDLNPTSEEVSAAVDAWLAEAVSRRSQWSTAESSAELDDDFSASVERLGMMKEVGKDISLYASSQKSDQIRLIADVLSANISRCVSAAWPSHRGKDDWDSHNDNENRQIQLYEDLGEHLIELMQVLDSTPGTVGDTLADETVVVVMTEMGRTPALNSVQGRDHWPYTTQMLIGPGITGNRSVGGWSDGFTGRGIDRATGDVDDDADIAGMSTLGATLLALGDVDPGVIEIGDDEAITGILS